MQRHDPGFRSADLRLANIEQLRLFANRHQRCISQVRHALQQQRVFAHVRYRLVGELEYLHRTELCIGWPPLRQRLPAFQQQSKQLNLIVANTHRKAVELAKRHIVGHRQACKQTSRRQHHAHPNGRRLKPANIERIEHLCHLVIALVDFRKRAIE